MNRIVSFMNIGLFIILMSQVTHQPDVVPRDLNNTIQLPDVPSRQLQAATVTQPFKDIQINRLPHPFNINGNMPYQVWVDGVRVPLNSKEAKELVKSLDLKFVQPDDTAEIHSGAGWLHPLDLTKPEQISRTR